MGKGEKPQGFYADRSTKCRGCNGTGVIVVGSPVYVDHTARPSVYPGVPYVYPYTPPWLSPTGGGTTVTSVDPGTLTYTVSSTNDPSLVADKVTADVKRAFDRADIRN